MPQRKDDGLRIVTEFEWKLSLRLNAALDFRPITEEKDSGGTGDTARWRAPSRWALDEFHRMAVHGTDDELAVAADMFAAKAGRLPRAQRSTVLTLLLRTICDALQRHDPVRESETSMFGRFVNELIGDRPGWHVEWMEDMRSGVPETALDPQPVAVIRGVLLSTYIVLERMRRFWDLAVGSERFPREVFSEPCAPEDGRVFSSVQSRRFGALFSAMSESAAVAFAAHMAARAVTMFIFVRDEDTNSYSRERVPAPEKDRQDAMRAVLGAVTPPSRRAVIADAFGLAAA